MARRRSSKRGGFRRGRSGYRSRSRSVRRGNRRSAARTTRLVVQVHAAPPPTTGPVMDSAGRMMLPVRPKKSAF